jgi:succinyl-CoA synthetase beta subunit
MRLHEYEGKQLLKRHNVAIPRGALWPEMPAALPWPRVVKAQISEGGRGKRGGIRIVEDTTAEREAVRALQAGSAVLPPADAVLVEERIAVADEYYFALVMDRGAGGPVLLGSARGGIDIDSVSEEAIARIPLRLRLSDDDTATVDLQAPGSQLAAALGLTDEPAFQQIVCALWSLFRAEDCLLAEINPLARTADGAWIALDARLVLDDAARARHREWPSPHEGTEFECRCATTGATGTEMDGAIAIVTSGAGLGMATVDAVTAFGGRVRCLVDLGGNVFTEPESIAAIIDAVRTLRPRAVLCNCFFQLARCDTLATGIATALSREPLNCPVVARMRGVNAAEAWGILSPWGVLLTEEMDEACRMAVTLSGDAIAEGACDGHPH